MRTLAATVAVFILVLSSALIPFAAGDPQDYSSYSEFSSNLISRRPPPKPSTVSIGSGAQIDRVIVKLVEGSRGRLSGEKLISLVGKDLREVNSIIKAYSGGAVKRLTDKSPELVERDKFLLENRCGRQLADFNNYFSIPVASAVEAENLVNRLNRLPQVEIAYAEPRPFCATDIDPPTPDYDSIQRYLRPAPEGIDADYAQTIAGGDGSGVRIVDIEGNWKFDHEDLEAAVGGLLGGSLINDAEWRNHGSAVIGVLIGGDNGYGVTGIVPGANIDMVSIGGIGTTEAILLAIDSLIAGDIILIELHAPGPRYNFELRPDQRGYVCMEYWDANFDAIQMAWAKGIIVVEAAGNGYENLDDPIFENRFDTTYRNSHAIMVGAGAPPSGNFGLDRSRLSYSNFGQRLNLQGYGYEVVTAGYGDLFNGGGDERQFYTASFGGTSSASPIVTGAAAALQGIYIARYGTILDADRIRDILRATGSPQQPSSSQNIGPRPDLRAADSALPPPPYLTLDPIYFDTTVAADAQLSVFLQMQNVTPDKSVEYSATAMNDMGKSYIGDWLAIANPTGVVLPLDYETLEIILDATVIESRLTKYKGLVEIYFGEQGGPLDQHLMVPVFLNVPCADTTYSIRSSNDPDGPTFNWIDISATGSRIPDYAWYNDFVSHGLMDDGTAGPYYIGFDFPFYDTTFKYIYIGANGGFSFTDTNVNINGYYAAVPIPGPPFKTFIAAYWNDLNLDPSFNGHGSVYFTRQKPDTFIISFHDAAMYTHPHDSTITFQAIFTRDGNITFQYLSVGVSGMEDSAVVGIAELICRAAPYVLQGAPAEHVVGDSMAVLFDYAYVIWEMSGDANNDGDVNVGDAVYLINWIFKGGPAPRNLKEADANCDGNPNVGDVVYIINYVFKSGPAPCLYEL